jgi:hypothetical protein
LLHVDVEKLGNLPDDGGWRFVGRAQGDRHRAVTPGKPRHRHHHPTMGTAPPRRQAPQPAPHPTMGTTFVHTVSGDHSRIAYAEIHDDETGTTATGVLRRAVAWFAARGVTTERVLSDNGACYPLTRLADGLLRPGHPAEVHPPLPAADQWEDRTVPPHPRPGLGLPAALRHRDTPPQRLPGWLHEHNHHRPHTAIGGHPPINRLANLSEQYI